MNKPYMIKKDYKQLTSGLCRIRKGSCNKVMAREDFDMIYNNKESFEIILKKSILHAINDTDGCARIEVNFINNTNRTIILNRGWLTITNGNGIILTRHNVYGFESFVGADFKLTLSPKDEKIGEILVGFESSDCVKLGVNEDGTCDNNYTFKFDFYDTRNKVYSETLDSGSVYASGEILWKVKLKGK